MVKDDFFDRPIGAAVLFLNNFHHGKHLNDLNRCAWLVPDDVMGMASLLARSPEAHDSTAKLVIDTLISWADEAENAKQ